MGVFGGVGVGVQPVLLKDSSSIIIPESTQQAPLGVDGVYNTQDLEYEGGILGFSFQW